MLFRNHFLWILNVFLWKIYNKNNFFTYFHGKKKLWFLKEIQEHLWKTPRNNVCLLNSFKVNIENETGMWFSFPSRGQGMIDNNRSRNSLLLTLNLISAVNAPAAGSGNNWGCVKFTAYTLSSAQLSTRSPPHGQTCIGPSPPQPSKPL